MYQQLYSINWILCITRPTHGFFKGRQEQLMTEQPADHLCKLVINILLLAFTLGAKQNKRLNVFTELNTIFSIKQGRIYNSGHYCLECPEEEIAANNSFLYWKINHIPIFE